VFSHFEPEIKLLNEVNNTLVLKTFIDYGGRTVIRPHYFTWNNGDFKTPEGVEESMETLELRFAKALEIIQTRVNPDLKGKDLSNFKKVDEVLRQIYQDLSLPHEGTEKRPHDEL
jgi:hypothetical protein